MIIFPSDDYNSIIIFESNDTLPKVEFQFHIGNDFIDEEKKVYLFAPTLIDTSSGRHFEKVFGQVKVPWAATLDTIH